MSVKPPQGRIVTFVPPLYPNGKHPALNYLRMRLFVGIPLAPAVVSELSAAVARLKSGADALRWMPPESWHITLQFLGNTSPEQYGCLLARLAQLRSSPIPIRLGELDFFDRAGVFFASIAPAPELVTLAQRVSAATAHCGFAAEERPFHPHITLARSKGQNRALPLRALKAKVSRQPVFTRFSAAEFLLYESHLAPTGSIYQIRARFNLIQP